MQAKQLSLEALLDKALRAPLYTSAQTNQAHASLVALGLNGSTVLPKRSGAPVRRNSRLKGREGVFWRPVRRADVRILIRAAERLELTEKLRGKKNGPIGAVGLEVLRELARLVDYRTGQLDPCYDTIALRTRRARSAVVAAVRRLRLAGFLDWLRRFEPDPDARGRKGPQVKQTSNAYRFAMPAFVARLLGVYAFAAPLPDDVVHHFRTERAKRERWEFEDSPLFTALQRLGNAINRTDQEA